MESSRSPSAFTDPFLSYLKFVHEKILSKPESYWRSQRAHRERYHQKHKKTRKWVGNEGFEGAKGGVPHLPIGKAKP